MIALWVCLAGGLGAMTRFLLDGVARSRYSAVFPWPTVVINVTGSLLLGVVLGLVMFEGQSSRLLLVVGTGFCGGYTTFSAASFETVLLVRQRRFWFAVLNAVGTPVLTVVAGTLGVFVVHH